MLTTAALLAIAATAARTAYGQGPPAWPAMRELNPGYCSGTTPGNCAQCGGQAVTACVNYLPNYWKIGQCGRTTGVTTACYDTAYDCGKQITCPDKAEDGYNCVNGLYLCSVSI